MRSYYNIIDKLHTYLNGNASINTVTFGDLLEVDLSKQTIFPLAHVNIQNVAFEEHVMNININVVVMDLVDEDKDDKQDKAKPHLGLDNKHDIQNTLLTVVNGIQSAIRRGELYDDLFHLNTDPTAQLFEDKFENKVTGWSMDLSIRTPNNDMALINRDGTECQ
jgi:hypothetical protein